MLHALSGRVMRISDLSILYCLGHGGSFDNNPSTRLGLRRRLLLGIHAESDTVPTFDLLRGWLQRGLLSRLGLLF